jgi:hypothetical protein
MARPWERRGPGRQNGCAPIPGYIKGAKPSVNPALLASAYVGDAGKILFPLIPRSLTYDAPVGTQAALEVSYALLEPVFPIQQGIRLLAHRQPIGTATPKQGEDHLPVSRHLARAQAVMHDVL